MTQIPADEGKIGLFRVDSFDTADFDDGIVLEDIATETVDGVRGINDNSPLPQAVCHPADLPRLRIVRMYGQEHETR